MTTTTAVSVEELEAMLGDPPACEFPTLDVTDHVCTRTCGLPGVRRWKVTCRDHGETVVWACDFHDRKVLEGAYTRCAGTPTLWLPA